MGDSYQTAMLLVSSHWTQKSESSYICKNSRPYSKKQTQAYTHTVYTVGQAHSQTRGKNQTAETAAPKQQSLSSKLG